MHYGAHVTVAGGLERGPAEGRAIGADAIQVFTRNQRTWKAKPVTSEEVDRFAKAVEEHGIRRVMSHASYLLNLASPDEAARAKSVAGFVAEVERGHLLGVHFVAFHPGSHLGEGEESGLARVVESLREVVEATDHATGVRILIENTAGQGTNLGHRFEQLRTLLDGVDAPARLGICFDTAHAFAAGYDLRGAQGLRDVMTTFDDVVGLDQLHAFHLNDSKPDLGSRVDRHENLGEGCIGWEAFAALVTHESFVDATACLETPGGPDRWREELRRLREAAGQVSDAANG